VIWHVESPPPSTLTVETGLGSAGYEWPLSGGKRQWYKQRQNAAKTGHIGSHPEKGILGRGVSDD